MDLVMSKEELKDKYKDENENIENILENVSEDAEALMKAFAGNDNVEMPNQEIKPEEQTNEDTSAQPLVEQDETEKIKSIIAMEGTVAGIDENVLNPEICLFAINFNKKDLHNIPVKYRTEEICSIALEQDYTQFKDVPEQLLTEEFVTKCINKNSNIISVIGAAYLNVKIIDNVLTANPNLIRSVPDSIRPSASVLNNIYKLVDADTKAYMVQKYNGKTVQQQKPVQQPSEQVETKEQVSESTTEPQNDLVQEVKQAQQEVKQIKQEIEQSKPIVNIPKEIRDMTIGEICTKIADLEIRIKNLENRIGG